jgi:DNA-binding beta-propeller fold protein YncE
MMNPTDDQLSGGIPWYSLLKSGLVRRSIIQWGNLGKTRGQMIEPADLVLDGQEKTVYVADKGNNRIDKFDLNGNFIGAWGSSGSEKGQFDNPPR